MADITISDVDIDKLTAEYNSRVIDTRKHWRFDDARRHVIKSWDDVQACPGSGKTTLVAAKLLILAKKWKEPNSGICVLTHTNIARDEIISRLHNHPAGFKLTSYPHFIGTIQEFVNRYLGLPFCRSNNLCVTRIDDDTCVQEIERNISYGTKSYLEKKHASLYDLILKFESNDLNLNVPGFPNTSESKSYKELEAAKGALLQSGLYFFSEMYSFANKLVADNSEVIGALQKRFPIVLVDEMQDTQKNQDTLLNLIFDNEHVSLQRLGDPDQAIFDGIGGDEPNESYNSKEDLYEINTTHRFGLDICEKLIGLSYHSLHELTSDREPDRGDYRHTIFIYDDDSQEHVLDCFSELLAEVDPEDHWHTVKAVGGLDGESGQIRKYWSKFDKTKSVTLPKPKKLIHIVHRCKDSSQGNVSPNYDLLLQGVVDLLRKAEVKIDNGRGERVNYSRRSLVGLLKSNEKYHQFRKLLTAWITGSELSINGWTEQVATLKIILELGALGDKAADFLSFDDEYQGDGEEYVYATNMYICANSREIEVSTIHSAKGETHDATLILETKFNRWFDVLEMLPFMLDKAKDRPIFIPNSKTKETTLAQYMRKLYVAGSRPRYLLCLAIHSDHMNEEQSTQMQELGWAVVDV